MSENERDTHFLEPAKLLWKELLELNGYGYIDVSDAWSTDDGEHEPYIHHLAQRLYDLVKLAYLSTGEWDQRMLTVEEQIAKLPDLTELPTEPTQSAVPGSSTAQSPPEVA